MHKCKDAGMQKCRTRKCTNVELQLQKYGCRNTAAEIQAQKCRNTEKSVAEISCRNTAAGAKIHKCRNTSTQL
jgi:hypothetical protein